MEIWTKFVEPFFHLAPHSLDSDLMEVNSPEMEEVEQKDTMCVVLVDICVTHFRDCLFREETEEEVARQMAEEPVEGATMEPVSETVPTEEQASDG